MLDIQGIAGANFRYVLAVSVLVVGLITGYLVGRVNERVLRAAGVPATVEGTSVERSARQLGTTTVEVLARASSWFIYLVSALIALQIAQVVPTQLLWAQAGIFLPRIVVAVAVFVVGIVVSDKAEVLVSERLRGVKVPEINIVPRTVKWSIVFIASLVALGQLGIATDALIVLFGAYAVAVIVFGVAATRDLLAAAAAGVYLLLSQPYGIGDHVAVGDREGVVQEVDVFVTRIEEDGREYLVPNHLVMRQGAMLVRD